MSNVVIINQNDGYPYSKKDMCSMCECSERSFENFWKDFRSATDCVAKTFIIKGRNHERFYTEDVFKAFQAWLMKNQATQGKGSSLIKEQTTNAVATDLALTEIINTGNVEAFDCLMNHYRNEMLAVQQNKLLAEENRVLKHQLEYDKIIGCVKWSDVKKTMGIRDNFKEVCKNTRIEPNVDWYEKIMGEDKYPTKLLTDRAVDIIKEYYIG